MLDAYSGIAGFAGFYCLVGLGSFSVFVGFAAVIASASLFPFPLTGLAGLAGVAGLDPLVGFEAALPHLSFMAVGLPAVLLVTPDLLLSVLAPHNVLLGYSSVAS